MPTHPSIQAILSQYAKDVRDDLRTNAAGCHDGAGRELLLAPRFKSLLEAILPALFSGATVTTPRVLPEYEKGGVGRPDLALAQFASPASAFIELKEPGKSIDPTRLRRHDKNQFERFRELPLWALCNFHSIRLYQRDELLDQAIIVPPASLGGDTSDVRATRAIANHNPEPFLGIVEQLALARPPHPRSAREAAQFLAHAARLVRGIVVELVANVPRPDTVSTAPPLIQVREEFRDVLFSRPKAGGYEDDHGGQKFDTLFASAFAQTLAFGLLLAREASGRAVDHNADRVLPAGTYPLLKVTLQALLLPQVAESLGIGLGVLIDCVNSIETELLVKRYGDDPILYFYEDFLAVFDPRARVRYGVYFTPVEVVYYMVSSTERALTEGLGTEGLLDNDVLILDPACGTGTFLIAAASAAAQQAAARFGEGVVPAELGSLSRRLNGFEILVGPYTVAHYRLHRELVAAGAQLEERLPIYLADTLAPPGDVSGITGYIPFIDAPIVEERRQADRVKSRAPILAILGNPPYRRLRAREVNELIGPWMDGLWDDLKAPVRDAGWGLELNAFPDLYIAFYRWSLWKLFESEGSTGRGVLCLITNRRFLAGHTFAGLRRMLRQRFVRIEIVDLRGDSKSALPAGIADDENVFDIQVGVCVLTAWSDGKSRRDTERSIVLYADVFAHGAFTRADKLALLGRAAADRSTLSFVQVHSRDDMDNFRPEEPEFSAWPLISEIMIYRSTGIVTYRDAFAYGFNSEQLAEHIRTFLAMPPDDARTAFKETRDRSVGPALATRFAADSIVRIAYRPLDTRFLYNRREFIDFPKMDLQEVWGSSNVALVTMARGIGEGPAVWAHGLKPDQHSFRGSYGGFVFPLYDHNPSGTGSFVNARILDALSETYKTTVTPEEVFSVIICLLSATSYARRFASVLEDSFPRVLFPRNHSCFAQAARVGADIQSIEVFARAPSEPFTTARVQGNASAPVLDLPQRAEACVSTSESEGAIILRRDGSQRVVGVPSVVWQLGVSGYPLIWKWLDHRNGQLLDGSFYRDLLDVIARVNELNSLFLTADRILSTALSDPLKRSDLQLT